MRLTVELDGRSTVVEVGDDLSTVRIGERSYPVRVVRAEPTRLELEIGGETVVLAGWPEGLARPPGPVEVNGAQVAAAVRIDAGPGSPRPSVPPEGTVASGTGPITSPGPGAGPVGGTPVVPPMPGRVIEVKVREGEAVAQGAVLFVLEAMKMRNEVTAPVAGVVRELRAREGANVRARETLLVLSPT